MRRVLAGERGPQYDIAALNAAAALVVAGRAQSIDEGLRLARAALDGGQANRTLETLVRCSQGA